MMRVDSFQFFYSFDSNIMSSCFVDEQSHVFAPTYCKMSATVTVTVAVTVSDNDSVTVTVALLVMQMIENIADIQLPNMPSKVIHIQFQAQTQGPNPLHHSTLTDIHDASPVFVLFCFVFFYLPCLVLYMRCVLSSSPVHKKPSLHIAVLMSTSPF
jgi:hypothetical protein